VTESIPSKADLAPPIRDVSPRDRRTLRLEQDGEPKGRATGCSRRADLLATVLNQAAGRCMEYAPSTKSAPVTPARILAACLRADRLRLVAKIGPADRAAAGMARLDVGRGRRRALKRLPRSARLHALSQIKSMWPIAAAALFVLSIGGCGGALTRPATTPDAGATPVGPQTCEQLRKDVENAVFHLLAEHGTGCSTDSDCILISTSLQCVDGCETAVVTNESSSFLDEFESDGAAICAMFGGTCGSGPDCFAVVPRCVIGTCRAMTAM
jgi:hypothetical protein